MAKSTQAYYEHYKRQHRILGAYLAVQCWHNGYDAVLVHRGTFAHFHELKKFTDEHLSWLKRDLQPYFPHFFSTKYTKAPSKFAGVALSRVVIPSGFGEKSLTDLQRAEQWRSRGFRIAALSEFETTNEHFTERDATSFLALAATGLVVPALITPTVRIKRV